MDYNLNEVTEVVVDVCQRVAAARWEVAVAHAVQHPGFPPVVEVQFHGMAGDTARVLFMPLVDDGALTIRATVPPEKNSLSRLWAEGLLLDLSDAAAPNQILAGDLLEAANERRVMRQTLAA
jgi:hypothetical protein